MRTWLCMSLVVGALLSSCTPKKTEVVISFKTPEETFTTWRESAERLDFETLVACYATEARAQIRKDIEKSTPEELKAIQEETRKTKFRIEKIVYEKDKAYLRTARKMGREEEIEVVNMVREGQEWKLIP